MQCIQCSVIKFKEDFRNKRTKCKTCEASNQRLYYEKYKDKINTKQREKAKIKREEMKKLEGIIDNTKKCKSCHSIKELDQYSKGRAKCKDCIKLQDKNRYDKQREKLLLNTKICSRCHKRKNKNEFKQKTYCNACQRQMCRNYKANNRDKISAYNKIYKKAHKQDIKEYNKKYNKENRQAIQARQTRNQRVYRTIPQYKIALRLRGRIYMLMKKLKAKKCTNTLSILGCSLEFLCKWFEFKFMDDMTLNNYGNVWHIDHVIPCSAFNLVDEAEQKRCFHWTNLQPMVGIDNIVKNDKIDRYQIMDQIIHTYDFIQKYGKEFHNEFTLIEYNRFEYL